MDGSPAALSLGTPNARLHVWNLGLSYFTWVLLTLPVSSSFQAVQITSQTAGLAADECHHHWRIVLQRSHWQRTDRQRHPTHFKNGACRLQLSNHWPQPLKAEVTLLWTEFTVPSRDIRNQMELLLPGRLWIVTLRITKIESIFSFGFFKKNLSDQAGVRNYTTLSVL